MKEMECERVSEKEVEAEEKRVCFGSFCFRVLHFFEHLTAALVCRFSAQLFPCSNITNNI